MSPALAGRAGSCAVLQRCLRDPIAGPSVTAALGRFLPASLIDGFRAAPDPTRALDTFDGESETPALVWHGALRKTLRRGVASQLEAYRRSSSDSDGHPWALTPDVKVKSTSVVGCVVLAGAAWVCE